MTTSRPSKTRSEGQWALGNREPLNDAEKFKHDDAPLNVRDRILDVHAKEGFDSIDKDGLRGRFRWMGLYTQRGRDSSPRYDSTSRIIELSAFIA